MRRLVLALLMVSTAASAKAERRRTFGPATDPDLAELTRESREKLAVDDGRRFRIDVQPQLKMPFRPWLTGASVAWSPDGIWVADTENDAVAVSSADGKKVLRTIALGAGAAPEQVVVGPDGRAYVTLRGLGRVAAIAPDGKLATAQAGLEPFGLALSADGRTLWVSVSGAGEVIAYDALSLTEKQRFKVDPDPRGLAAGPEDDKLFVAHLTGRSVSVIDLCAHAVRKIALPGATRDRLAELAGESSRVPNLTFAMALSPSGRRVFVPHDLEDTGAQVAPEVRSGGYGAGASQPVVSSVTTLDAEAELVRGEQRGGMRGRMGFAMSGLSQPRAAVVDPARTRLFVAGLGSDEVRVLNTAYVDPGFAINEGVLSVGAGAGPKGLAISPDGKKLYVHAALKHTLQVFDVSRPRPFGREVASLAVGPELLPPEAVHGRQLFFTARDSRISAFGQFACATCHPEGRQDGLTWRLDKGPRQTPVLAGRLVGTAPYNWLGSKGSLQENMKETMGRLGGRGLKGKDLADLELYLTKYLDPGPRPALAANALVERGRQLFESDDVGCAHCHAPGTSFTDGKNHDVGTTTAEEVARIKIEHGELVPPERPDPTVMVGALVNWSATTGFLRILSGRAPTDETGLTEAVSIGFRMLNPEVPNIGLLALQMRSKLRSTGLPVGVFGLSSPLRPPVKQLAKKPKPPEPPRLRLAYNTPSLVGVGRSAPYFHDGSAPSLREVIVNNPGDRMGRTSQLARGDVDALVAYLETL